MHGWVFLPDFIQISSTEVSNSNVSFPACHTKHIHGVFLSAEALPNNLILLQSFVFLRNPVTNFISSNFSSYTIWKCYSTLFKEIKNHRCQQRFLRNLFLTSNEKATAPVFPSSPQAEGVQKLSKPTPCSSKWSHLFFFNPRTHLRQLGFLISLKRGKLSLEASLHWYALYHTTSTTWPWAYFFLSF